LRGAKGERRKTKDEGRKVTTLTAVKNPVSGGGGEKQEPNNKKQEPMVGLLDC
jgi:hypothetical protein